MASAHKFAICNELFQESPLRETCREVRLLGYDGIEIAPFTLAEDISQLSSANRGEIRRTIEDEGLEFVGLHWLLASPSGLHITSCDPAVRKRSWDFVHHLIDLCADLTGRTSHRHPVMVLGSPKQRSTFGGMTTSEAVDVITHELGHAAPHAESAGVRILLEALSPDQTDVVTSMSEAVAIVKQIGSDAVQTMFDTHNAREEKEPHTELLRKYVPYIRHVHVNEMDGREPGAGDYDFSSLLQTLARLDYEGWISVELFDFSRSPREIAQRAIECLKAGGASSAAASK